MVRYLRLRSHNSEGTSRRYISLFSEVSTCLLLNVTIPELHICLTYAMLLSASKTKNQRTYLIYSKTHGAKDTVLFGSGSTLRCPV